MTPGFFSRTHIHIQSIVEQNSNDLAHGYIENLIKKTKKKEREMSFPICNAWQLHIVRIQSKNGQMSFYEMKNVIVWSCQIQKKS